MQEQSLGIVLLAHGSRDPLWSEPVQRVAQLLRSGQPGMRVACAYLELATPDLDTAVVELKAAGARAIHVLPLFLGVGKHLREDLPKLAARLRQAHPGLPISVGRPVGEDPRLLELIAGMALEGLARSS